MSISLIGRADLLSLGAETIGYKQTCSMVPSMYSIVFKYTYYIYVDCNTRTQKKQKKQTFTVAWKINSPVW